LGTWCVRPWPRASLFYFERTLQDAVGDPTLALPYWDWSDPAQRDIPDVFWADPLLDPARGVKPRDRLLEEFVGPGARDWALGAADFLPSFGGGPAAKLREISPLGAGLLEGGPHNSVHPWAGGDMGSPATAAWDPIFWLHHANIDRLWVQWLATDPGHLNPADPAWLGQQFWFVDEKGKNVPITVGD